MCMCQCPGKECGRRSRCLSGSSFSVAGGVKTGMWWCYSLAFMSSLPVPVDNYTMRKILLSPLSLLVRWRYNVAVDGSSW